MGDGLYIIPPIPGIIPWKLMGRLVEWYEVARFDRARGRPLCET